ncbi:ABC-type multidrug transport system, permease component [Moritella sp. JT01]|uniref:ABC transporter permease n=1 Tax=Moritella sp. JT01 TaxID=756698 RepID=UPI0007984B1E|nr:ABC transporter permease [Moritella sp. JT01]KXO12882.1 ABC-type multidrug transport system, permease component [Moritella sp. JT01]
MLFKQKIIKKPFWQLMLLNIRPFFREPAILFWTFGFPIFVALLMVQAFSGERSIEKVNLVVMESSSIDLVWLKSMELDPKINIIRINYDDSLFSDDSTEVVPNEELKVALSHYSSVMLLTKNGLYSTRNTQEQSIARSYILESKDQTSFVNGHISLIGYRYVDWLIPGIIVLQIIGIGLMSISNSLVSDRQQGLFKRLKLSPFKRVDYVIGIIFARVFLLTFQLILLFTAFYFIFDYRLTGSWLNTILILFLGSTALCLLGVLVGSRSKRVEVATGIANLLYFPLMFLSGIYFETTNFPETLQKIIHWLPSTAFLDAFRMVANEGASLYQVGTEIGILLGFSVFLLILISFLFDWGDER